MRKERRWGRGKENSQGKEGMQHHRKGNRKKGYHICRISFNQKETRTENARAHTHARLHLVQSDAVISSFTLLVSTRRIPRLTPVQSELSFLRLFPQSRHSRIRMPSQNSSGQPEGHPSGGHEDCAAPQHSRVLSTRRSHAFCGSRGGCSPLPAMLPFER